jgi:hypothetical protein
MEYTTYFLILMMVFLLVYIVTNPIPYHISKPKKMKIKILCIVTQEEIRNCNRIGTFDDINEVTKNLKEYLDNVGVENVNKVELETDFPLFVSMQMEEEIVEELFLENVGENIKIIYK